MARSYKKLRESLEDERKRRKAAEAELAEAQRKLSSKLRVIERYRELSLETEQVLSKKLNDGSDVEEMKRENVLRLETNNYISRLRETDAKLFETQNLVEDLKKSVEDQQNCINNQEYLIKQLQALNSEKTSEIKNFQELINKNKNTVDLSSSIEVRYASSLKHALAFGEFLLKKKVPLTKKHKHWLSNAHIWLDQLGEKKFKLPITLENWENQAASTCSINQPSDLNTNCGTVDESIADNSVIEEAAGSKDCESLAGNSVDSSPSISWTDEGIASPRLSVITQISSISVTSYASTKSVASVCSSTDSGISLGEPVSEDKHECYNKKTNYSEDLSKNITNSCKVNKDEAKESTKYLENKKKKLSLPILNEGLDLSSTECPSKCVKSVLNPKFSRDVCGENKVKSVFDPEFSQNVSGEDKPSENKHLFNGIKLSAVEQRVTPLSTVNDETIKKSCSKVYPSPIKDQRNSVESIFDPALSHKTFSFKRKLPERDKLLVDAESCEQQKDTVPLLDKDLRVLEDLHGLENPTPKQNVIESSTSNQKKVKYDILGTEEEPICDNFCLGDNKISKSNNEVGADEPLNGSLSSESGKSTFTKIESNVNSDDLRADEFISECIDSVENSLDVPCASDLMEYVNNENSASTNSFKNILLDDKDLTNSDDNLVVLSEQKSGELNNTGSITTDFSYKDVLGSDINSVKLTSITKNELKETIETSIPISSKNIQYDSGCVKISKFPGNICILQVIANENGVDNSSSGHNDHTYPCTSKNIVEGNCFPVEKSITPLPSQEQGDLNKSDNIQEQLSADLKNKILEITEDASENCNEVYFNKSSVICDYSRCNSVTTDHNLGMKTDPENLNLEKAHGVPDKVNLASDIPSITEKKISSVSIIHEKPISEDLVTITYCNLETDSGDQNLEKALEVDDTSNLGCHTPSITNSVGVISKEPVSEDIDTEEQLSILPLITEENNSFEIICKTSESLSGGNLYSCHNLEESVDKISNRGLHKTDILSKMVDPKEDNNLRAASSCNSEVMESDEHSSISSCNSRQVNESENQLNDLPSSDYNGQQSEVKGEIVDHLKCASNNNSAVENTVTDETLGTEIKNPVFLESSKTGSSVTCFDGLKTSVLNKTALICEQNLVEGELNVSRIGLNEKSSKNSLVPENVPDSKVKNLFENVSVVNSLMDTGIQSNDSSSDDTNMSMPCNDYESACVDSAAENDFKNCVSSVVVNNNNKNVSDVIVFEEKPVNDSCGIDESSNCADTEIESLLSEIKSNTSVRMRVLSPLLLKSPIKDKKPVSCGNIPVKKRSLSKKLSKKSSSNKLVAKSSNSCNKFKKPSSKVIEIVRKLPFQNSSLDKEKCKSVPSKISKSVSSDDLLLQSQQSDSAIVESKEKLSCSDELISNKSGESNELSCKDGGKSISFLESTDNEDGMDLNNIFSYVFCPDLLSPIYDLSDTCSNPELMVKECGVLEPGDTKLVEESAVVKISGCYKNTPLVNPVSEVEPVPNVKNQNKAKNGNVKQIIKKELVHVKTLSDKEGNVSSKKRVNVKDIKFERKTNVNENIRLKPCLISQPDEIYSEDTFQHANNSDQKMNEDKVNHTAMNNACGDGRVVQYFVKNHSNSAKTVQSKSLVHLKSSFKKIKKERIKKKCTLVDCDGSEESNDCSDDEDDSFIGFSVENDFSLVQNQLRKFKQMNDYLSSWIFNIGLKGKFTSETPIKNNNHALFQEKIQNLESIECNPKENSNNDIVILPSSKKDKIKEIITSDKCESVSDRSAASLLRNNCKEVIAGSRICVGSKATKGSAEIDKCKNKQNVEGRALPVKNVSHDEIKCSNLSKDKEDESMSETLNLRRSRRLLSRTVKEKPIRNIKDKLNASKMCQKTGFDSEITSRNKSTPKKTLSHKRSISATVSCSDQVKVDDDNNDDKMEEIKVGNTVESKMLLRSGRKTSGRETKSPSHDLCKYCLGSTSPLVPNLPHETSCYNSANSLETSKVVTSRQNCCNHNEDQVIDVKNVKLNETSENCESSNKEWQRFDKFKKRTIPIIPPIKLSASSKLKSSHSAQSSELVTQKKSSGDNEFAQLHILDPKINKPLIDRLCTDTDSVGSSHKNFKSFKTEGKFSDGDNKKVSDSNLASDDQMNLIKSNNLGAVSSVKTSFKNNLSCSPVILQNRKEGKILCNENKADALSNVNDPFSSVQNDHNLVELNESVERVYHKIDKTETPIKYNLSEQLPQACLDNDVSEELQSNHLKWNNDLKPVPTLLEKITSDISNDSVPLELPSSRFFQDSPLSEKSNDIYNNNNSGSFGLSSAVLSPPLSPEISSEISSVDNKNDGYENSSLPPLNFYSNANEEEIQTRKRKLSELSASDMDCLSSPKKLCVNNSEEITFGNNELCIDDKCESRIQDTVACHGSILQTALVYHKESLSTRKDYKKLKLEEANQCRIVEDALGRVQELCTNDKQFSSKFLNTTLKRLRSCEQKTVADMFIDLICIDTDEVVEDLTPLMTPLQRYIFPVAYNLCCDPDYPDFLMTFLKSVKAILFSNSEKCLVKPSENLAKFSTLLCRSLHAFYAMRWLMYDVLYMLRYRAVPIIQVMLTRWPKLMPNAQDVIDCPLSICINYVISSFKVENYYSTYYSSSRLRALLKDFYGYQMGESRDQVFERLLKLISNKGFMEAMILLCKKEGYEWTVAKIHDIFLPMLDSWPTGCVENVAVIIVTTLGYILRPFPTSAAGKTTHDVIARLEKILVDTEGSPIMQEAAAISICHLSRLNFDYCINVLQKWKPKNQAVSRSVVEGMKHMIALRKPVWWQKYFRRSSFTN